MRFIQSLPSVEERAPSKSAMKHLGAPHRLTQICLMEDRTSSVFLLGVTVVSVQRMHAPTKFTIICAPPKEQIKLNERVDMGGQSCGSDVAMTGPGPSPINGASITDLLDLLLQCIVVCSLPDDPPHGVGTGVVQSLVKSHKHSAPHNGGRLWLEKLECLGNVPTAPVSSIMALGVRLNFRAPCGRLGASRRYSRRIQNRIVTLPLERSRSSSFTVTAPTPLRLPP